MTEHSFIRALHKKIPSTVRIWKINDNFAGGVPDAFYRMKGKYNGTHVWVEYKYIKSMPKRANTLVRPDLSELQKLWLKEAADSGEKAYCVVGIEKQVLVLSTKEFDGLTVESANKRLISRDQYVSWLLDQLNNLPFAVC